MKEIILNKRIPLSRQVPKRMVEIEMFRAGEQMDSDGDKARFTEQDLDDIVQGYDPAIHEAPLIVGHEQDDSTPSLGWVRSMWRKGKSLWGKIELTPKAEKIISEGTFKKVSSSFYAPGADSNPNRGKLSLRHLALVSIPAVKGLADFSEITTEIISYDFSEKRSQTLFKDLLDFKTNDMGRPRTRKKTISDHGEGNINLTINVSPSGDENKKNLPVYDDDGNLLDSQGLPADYSDEAAEPKPPSFVEDEIPDEDMATSEGEEDVSEELEGEEELPPEEDDVPPEEQVDDEDPSSEEEEDISDEVEEGGDVVAELAGKYSAMDLVKALALKKKSTDMMESEAMESVPDMDFSEHKEDDEEEEKEFSEEDEEESEEKNSDCSDDKKDFYDPEEDIEDYNRTKKAITRAAKRNFEEEEDEDDISKLKERLQFVEEELQKQRKLAREKEISEFCESIYSSGKLLETVVPKRDLVKFMSTLNGKNAVNFSEDKKSSQFDFFTEVLNNLPAMVNFSEVATPESAPKKKKVPDVDELSGFMYDTKSLEMHAEALDFSEKNNVDYITALKSVIK